MGCILAKLCGNEPTPEEILEELTLTIDLNEKTVYDYKEWPFTHIVLEGGGINGISYLGVYLALRKSGIANQVTHLSASSIGTIFAIFLALKVPYRKVQSFIMNKDFDDLKDDKFGLLRDASHLMNNYGWYRGIVLSKWVKEILAEFGGNRNMTFSELYNKNGVELNIIGSNLNEQKEIVYNRYNTPNKYIHEATVASMSIPIAYPPVREKSTKDGVQSTNLIVDGGMANNYDLDRFDKEGEVNPHVLGLKIMDLSMEKRNDTIYDKRIEINNFTEYISGLIGFQSIIIERLRMKNIAKYWERTLTVPSLGLPMTEFDIDNRTKANAVVQSYNFTIAQLNGWIKNKRFVEVDPSHLVETKEKSICN